MSQTIIAKLTALVGQTDSRNSPLLDGIIARAKENTEGLGKFSVDYDVDFDSDTFYLTLYIATDHVSEEAIHAEVDDVLENRKKSHKKPSEDEREKLAFTADKAFVGNARYSTLQNGERDDLMNSIVDELLIATDETSRYDLCEVVSIKDTVTINSGIDAELVLERFKVLAER
jgi:hypothetical protein